LPVAERKMPGGSQRGRVVDRAMRKEALVFAGDDGVFQNLRKLACAEPRRADHVLDIDAFPVRMSELAGGQDRVEQAPARQVPPVALGDHFHQREDDGHAQGWKHDDADGDTKGSPPQGSIPAGRFRLLWPPQTQESHDQSYRRGTTPLGANAAATAANPHSWA